MQKTNKDCKLELHFHRVSFEVLSDWRLRVIWIMMVNRVLFNKLMGKPGGQRSLAPCVRSHWSSDFLDWKLAKSARYVPYPWCGWILLILQLIGQRQDRLCLLFRNLGCRNTLQGLMSINIRIGQLFPFLHFTLVAHLSTSYFQINVRIYLLKAIKYQI